MLSRMKQRFNSALRFGPFSAKISFERSSAFDELLKHKSPCV